jgi:CheY-like chemotaxis protein
VGSLFRLELPWPAVHILANEAPENAPGQEPKQAPEPAAETAPQAAEQEPIEVLPRPGLEALATEGPETASRQARARSTGLHLLVVDDVAANRAVLRALLTADGHLITGAENGAEAVALTSRDRFDVVLMDVRMSVMDGIEATRRIRKLPGEAGSTPIIGISADVMPETTRACLAAGMSAMLAKPIERDALVSTLRRLELHRYQPSVREMAPSGSESNPTSAA